MTIKKNSAFKKTAKALCCVAAGAVGFCFWALAQVDATRDVLIPMPAGSVRFSSEQDGVLELSDGRSVLRRDARRDDVVGFAPGEARFVAYESEAFAARHDKDGLHIVRKESFGFLEVQAAVLCDGRSLCKETKRLCWGPLCFEKTSALDREMMRGVNEAQFQLHCHDREMMRRASVETLRLNP